MPRDTPEGNWYRYVKRMKLIWGSIIIKVLPGGTSAVATYIHLV
jgi:hypothetical protein